MHVKIARHGHVGFTSNPGHGSPAVPASGINFTQRRSHSLNLRMLFPNAIDHTEEGSRIEPGCGCDFWTGNAESLLQVLFVSNQHVNILHDALDNLGGAVLASRDLP